MVFLARIRGDLNDSKVTRGGLKVMHDLISEIILPGLVMMNAGLNTIPNAENKAMDK